MEAAIDFVNRSNASVDPIEMKDYARRRLDFALRRFAPHVRRVTVRFEDVNGPRRGIDSRCALVLQLADGRTVAAEATTAWPFSSITRAARRAGAVLQKELERTRAYRTA